MAPATPRPNLDAPAFVAKMGRADEEVQPELFVACRADLERWRDADLSADSRCEFYEHAGHYFQVGPTQATMDHLYFGGNVADYVVADIDAWIRDVTET